MTEAATTGRSHDAWWAAVRIAIGLVFLWAFMDKAVGLGFDTCRVQTEEGAYAADIDYLCNASFVKGGAPTFGFLELGTEGSHTGDLFAWMAPAGPRDPNLADWGFMAGLLAVGVGLTFGAVTRVAAIGGAVMLVFMYLAGFVWPDHHPFLDDHLIYALVLAALAATGAGQTWSVDRLRSRS